MEAPQISRLVWKECSFEDCAQKCYVPKELWKLFQAFPSLHRDRIAVPSLAVGAEYLVLVFFFAFILHLLIFVWFLLVK